MMAATSSTTAAINGQTPTMDDGFKLFDMADDVSDHFYLSQKPNGINTGTNTYKTIVREWKLLEEGLPESIFVRAYETRIDLLRAVIIGAANTPYHDGLFFFDIAFPSDYPRSPPKVYFRSHSLRINPNLYISGYVCLSLLNTWIGSKKEKWIKSQSTILQVLISLQALVLNEKPYYNEPGTGRFGSEKSARVYNENVFLLSCRIMTFTIKNPPKNFEAFVADHFRRRAMAILSACEAYTNNRVQVGYYRDGMMAASYSVAGRYRISTTFKKDMEVLYPILVSWFNSNGASLENSIQQLIVEKETKPKKVKKGKKENNKGILHKVIGKIKGFFGIKKKIDHNINKSVQTNVN